MESFSEKTQSKRRFRKRFRRIPFIQQLEAADCAVCCLSMVLRLHGNPIPVTDVRDAVGPTPFGVSLPTILESGRRFGLHGRALRIHWSQVGSMSQGAILHWEFNHVVVFDRVVQAGVKIVDPAYGHRTVPMHDFARKYTGLLIQFEQTEDFTPVKRSERKIITHFGMIFRHRKVIRKILVASVVIQLVGVVFPILTGLIVDGIIPRDDRETLSILGLGAVILVAFSAISELARAYSLVYLRAKYDLSATTGFVSHMLSLPFEFFQKRSVGDLMLRVHSNTSIREILSTAALSAAIDGGMVSIYGIILFIIAPNLALVTLAVGGGLLILLLGSKSQLTERMADELYTRSVANSQLVQTLHGIHTLKAVGAEREALRAWETRFVDELNSVNRRQSFKAGVESIIHFIQLLSPVAILYVGALAVIDGSLTLGTMLAASALSAAFLLPLMELTKSCISIFEVKTHLERIHDVVSQTKEQGGSGALERVDIRGQVRLDQVTFKHEGSGRTTVNDFSLVIDPCQRIAIVGASGSGKSTLVHLLLGLYPPDSGKIYYDGVDLHRMPLGEVRRAIGFVPQDPYLFEGTVRQNISLTRPEASLHEVVIAARLACVHDDVMSMLNGYDTRITSGGQSLSGGQRQRIALARAVLGRPKIIILDEATSALDAKTESVVTRNLERLDCTRIVVAHRLSTIRNSDVVVVMSEGRIVEVGTHDELLLRKAEYSKLLAAQV